MKNKVKRMEKVTTCGERGHVDSFTESYWSGIFVRRCLRREVFTGKETSDAS